MSRGGLIRASFALIALSSIGFPQAGADPVLCETAGPVVQTLDPVTSTVLGPLCPAPDTSPSPTPAPTTRKDGTTATPVRDDASTTDAGQRGPLATAPDRSGVGPTTAPDPGPADAPSVTDPAPPVSDPIPGEPSSSPVRSLTSGLPLAAIAALGLIGCILAGLAGLRLGRRRAHAERDATLSEHLDAVLGIIPDGIVVTDRAHRVIALNGSAGALLGVRAEQVRGRALASILRGTDAHGRPLALWARAHSDRTSATTATLPSDRTIALSVAPLPGDGRAFVLRDLSRERALEEMKADFLSNVSHELRTPLTSALGFARLVRDRELTEHQSKVFVNAIVNACEKLDRVVDLLIVAATLRGGRIPMDGDDVAPAELAREVVDGRHVRAPAHVFSVREAATLPRMAANRSLLRQALEELIDNAVKFSPEGGLVTTAIEEKDGIVRISVADQGLGIPADQLDMLFEDFHQVDGSATRSFGGLGLGLGFVRRVAEAHGGHVTVASEAGSGSTFTIELPVRAPSSRVLAPASPRTVPVRAPRRATVRS